MNSKPSRFPGPRTARLWCSFQIGTAPSIYQTGHRRARGRECDDEQRTASVPRMTSTLGDLIFPSRRCRPRNPFLYFRDSHNRRTSSHGLRCRHLERAVRALAINGLPVSIKRGNTAETFQFDVRSGKKYGTLANRSRLQLELIPRWFATSHRR